MTNPVKSTSETTSQGAELYSLTTARVLRVIGAPLSASRRSQSQIAVTFAAALKEEDRSRRAWRAWQR